MKVTRMPLSELHAAPYNPRQELRKTDPRYRKLRRSIQEFGLVEPLVWNRRTGHVVGGHQRLRVLRDLGVQEAPVSIVDLPPEREKALNVMLNNREAQSDWDVGRLENLLSELSESPQFDLRLTGFDAHHLDLLRERLTPALAEPTRESKEPERVEIVLAMPAATFEALRAELDALVEKHALESHVRLR